MVILGIDPSIVHAGFSVISKRMGGVILLDGGVVSLSSRQPIGERLHELYDFFAHKIETFAVTHIALETPFLGKNAQNFLKLGYVRGIIHLLVHRYKLCLFEFAPCEVKRAVVGTGSAQKEHVARAIARLFPGFSWKGRFDLTDAIALSLCGFWRTSSRMG